MRHVRTVSAVAGLLAALLVPHAPAAAQVRNPCGTPPGELQSIGNDILDECNAEGLTELEIRYSEAARYYFCRADLARRARDQEYDDTTYNLVNAQIDSAQGLLKAAKAALIKKGDPKSTKDALDKLKSAVEDLKDAAGTASKGFGASAEADEFHRLGMNALHQANNAQDIVDQWQERNDAGEDCPPSDDPFDEDNKIPDDGDTVVGTYSGFGITVKVLARGAMKIISDCREDDHRIQIRGVVNGQEQGTWQTVESGVTEYTFSPPQNRDYVVRRKCGNEFSGAVMVPFKK